MKKGNHWTGVSLASNWEKEFEGVRATLLEALSGKPADDDRKIAEIVNLLKDREGEMDSARLWEFLKNTPPSHLYVKPSILLDSGTLKAATKRSSGRNSAADSGRKVAVDKAHADEQSASLGGATADEKLARRKPAGARDAPPHRAELALRFALPKDQREYLIGDLEEEFRSEMVPKFGYRMAVRWYWVQVLKAVASAFGARLRVWLGISALTSAVGWLVGKMGL